MIEKLRKILTQEDTVLFIGSGVSLWSGLPSWSGLIQELIAFLTENGIDARLTEQELKRGELLQAASYGFDKLTKPQFAQFIRKTSRLGSAQPHDIHNKITSLGPTCYITTNYDKLLELSFQKWNSDKYFRTIVNTQLTETAEIVGARSNSFLFKLHGDAENSDSIILTREQYRELNPGGELYHALETARTLMLSRPIVYIGFGLRDPDFLYLKDLLYNTYKGGARDHYAIMADIGDEEKIYWHKNYGIHLIDYQTIEKPDGKKDHTPILILLDSLKTIETLKSTSTLVLSSEFILSLNRHAAKYYGFETSKLHLPLIVHPIETKSKKEHSFQFYEASIEKLLDDGPDKLILIGLPGGGKSYSIKASVSRLSKILSRACIEDSVKINETIIPIYVDLKLYDGDLIKLIEQSIPVGMSISTLCSNFKVKLYLDAYNEVPKDLMESKSWNADFSALLEKYNFNLIISSRTIDGLEDLELPAFNLDSIDNEFIKTSLVQNKLEVKGIFRNEIINLLQKPLFYKLVFENKFEIESDTNPHKIYSSLIALINNNLNERFNVKINLLEPLSNVAMEALNHGEEAFKIELFKKYIELEIKKNTSISSIDVLNWLVSQDFLIPLVNERICFFHQSVTEYLASTKIASLFIENDKILKEKLRYRRWDQALFLCLSLLEKDEAGRFLETVTSIDFELALSAVKYLEEDTQEVVQYLLNEIDTSTAKDWEWQSQIGHKLRHSLPLTVSHIHTLKNLIKKGNTLGGHAVGSLIDLMGDDFKKEAFNLLVDYSDDYNFCTEIGRSLKKYIIADDIPALLILCQNVQDKLNDGKIEEFDGFDSALGNIMEGFDPKIVFSTFYNKNRKPEEQQVHLEVLCEYLQDCKNNEGLKICIDLLSFGIDKIVIQIYFILKFSKEEENIDYSIFEAKHINSLLEILKRDKNENSEWALSSLNCIFQNREDLKACATEYLYGTNRIYKAAIFYSISRSKDYTNVFQSLEELIKMNSKSLKKENFKLLSHMDDLNWIGQEKLFVKLLQLKNVKLAYNLCDMLAIYGEKDNNLIFDIGPVDWWLDWFTEFIESNSKEWMFIDRVPTVITNYISKEKRKEFISEFNNPESQYRKILSRIVLKKMGDLKLNDFTAEALSYLFEELKTIKIDPMNSSILVDIATEHFVTNNMLPLFKDAKQIERINLEILIEKIGRQHNRRYLIE